MRKESWNLLSYLCNQFTLPWFCHGDFNEILSLTEKSGGALRSQHQMNGFREAVNLCGFQDLGYLGPKFTLCNLQEGSNRVYLRLDRAFANSDWLNLFGNVKVQHQVESTSDHCILRISDFSYSPLSRNRRFHFEALWTKREDYHEIIKIAWNSGDPATTPEGIASNLSKCAAGLSMWNREVFGNIPKKIQEKRNRLNILTTQDFDGSKGAEINQLRKELNNLLDSEEVLWHQRSKVH